MGLTFPLARRLSRPLAHCLLSEGGQGITKADLLLATKGWDDTTPGALKTDLVAKFTAAYSESLRVAIAGTGLDFTGPFTLAAWVKGSVGGNGATQYVFNTNGYQLTVNPIGGFFFRLIGGSLITIPGGLTGNWQLVTLGFNGTDLVYSIDGVVDTIASAAPNVATGNFIIGTSDFEMGPAGAWDTDLSPPQIERFGIWAIPACLLLTQWRSLIDDPHGRCGSREGCAMIDGPRIISQTLTP